MGESNGVHCTAPLHCGTASRQFAKEHTRERESESGEGSGWAPLPCAVRVFLLLLRDAMAEGQAKDWSEEEAERLTLKQGGATGGAGRERERSKNQYFKTNKIIDGKVTHV